MNVATILREKGRTVHSEPVDATIRMVARRLVGERVGALVLLDRRGDLAGIISERDIVRAVAAHDCSILDEPAETIMTRNVVTCAESDSVAAVMAVMTDGRFRHVPVMNNGRLVGLISIGDVVKNHIAEVEMEASALKTYLVAG